MFLPKCSVCNIKKQKIYQKTRSKQIFKYLRIKKVVPLKDAKGITITNTFQKILKESNSHEAKSERRKTNLAQ